MVTAEHVVLIPLNSPQAAIRVYDALIATDNRSPGCWRDCAARLRRAATEAHEAIRVKYIDRAVDCEMRAARLEVVCNHAVTVQMPVFVAVRTVPVKGGKLCAAPSSAASRAVTDVLPCFGGDEVRS